MVRELARRGHEVTLACRAGAAPGLLERIRSEGVERVATLALRSGVHPTADLGDVRRLTAWLRRVDLVHVHRGKEHWLAALANRLAANPRPLVRTRHIVQSVRPHAANRWLYRQTHLVVAVMEAIRQQYLAAGLVSPSQVVTLLGGVDTDRFQPRAADGAMRRRLGAGPEDVLVGMVAGLRPMKGHRVVVEAAARLGADSRGLRFAFVGRGGHEPPLRDLLHRTGLAGRFTLAGYVEDALAAMLAFDIALYVPLESDGMSRVVWEYLAAGRPLIAARVGAVAEALRDGEHALLVHAGDPDDLADALRRLGADPALRQRLAAAGRALVVERYSAARVADALETCYRALCP
jgi:glycosyltransferase involved in cell wall biosynthesis